MVRTDRLPEEGCRLAYPVCDHANAGVTQGFVSSIPKALLKAGALGSEKIA